MDTKGWGDLDTRQWWIGVIVVAFPSMLAAFSTGHYDIAIISVGVLVWAFGEWVQHPVQWFRKNGKIGNVYKRHWSLFGVILNMIGIGLVIFGVCRVLEIDLGNVVSEFSRKQ